MPVALRSRSIPERDQHRLVALLEAATHGEPDRVRNLGGDRDRERRESVATRIPGTVSEAAEERKHFGRVHAAAHCHAELPVAWKDPIRLAERKRRADVDRFLAQELTPEAKLALSLQVECLLVGPTDENHLAVEVAQGLGG